MTTRLWQNLTESPAVLASRRALVDLPKSAGFPDPMDVRLYVMGDTMPIENIRRQFEAMDMPSGMYLGEVFERRVYNHLIQYHLLRDHEVSVEQFASDAQFSYRLNKEPSSGRWTSLDICVTPSPIVLVEGAGADWIEFVTNWLNWLLPWFSGAITITLCTFAETGLYLIPGAAATVHRRAATTRRA